MIAKLWNQRLFADVKVGATIDGDSVDMEISVRERPRVYRWLFEGEGVGQRAARRTSSRSCNSKRAESCRTT